MGPHLHVQSNGQVSVVLEPRKKRMAQVQGGRSDWVVIMEFEAVVERGNERGFNKVRSAYPLSPSPPPHFNSHGLLTSSLSLPLSTYSPGITQEGRLIKGLIIITKISPLYNPISNNPTPLRPK